MEMNNFIENNSAPTVKKIQFVANRSCIPTLPQSEQEDGLLGLDVEVYRQDVFEKGILDQVNEAFKSDQEKNLINFLCQETEENEPGKSDKSNGEFSEEGSERYLDRQSIENIQKNNLVEAENEKSIFEEKLSSLKTVTPQRIIEGNHFENIEEYLKKQIKIINEWKTKKRKLGAKRNTKSQSQCHNSKFKKLKLSSQSSQSNAKNSTDSTVSKSDIQIAECNKSKSLKAKGRKQKRFNSLDDSSGSEYIPSESDYNDDDVDDDSDSDLEPESKLGKRKKKKIKSLNDEGDTLIESDPEYENFKSHKIKGKTDDGNEVNYLTRIENWEKLNCREEIEAQVKDLGDGFKIPLTIWNKLYDYQKVGVQWLWNLNLQQCGGIIGDEMGLGKTIQIIAFLAGLRISKLLSRHGNFRGLGPVLIVCPTTVMHQWVKEFHNWWPQFRVALLHESGTFNGKKNDLIRDIVRKKEILITSYVTCVQQNKYLLHHIWHYVILDEGHKIRNPESQITHTMKLFQTPHRLILSGSPIQNNLKELWSLFDFIFPGKLGTLPVFLEKFGVPITQGGFANASQVQVITGFKCATVLRDTISPYLLRRSKEDVKSHISLPPKNEQVLFCKLTEEQKQLYLDYLNSGKVTEVLNGNMRIFVALIDLRKICNHPDLCTGGPKLPIHSNSMPIPVAEKYGHWKRAGKMIVLETILRIWKKQMHRVLIFTQSRKMLSILENFILENNYEYIKIDGSTTIGSRQPLINKFNEDKKYFIFLSTTQVGGLGVNLTGANRVVIYDPDWNPATDIQARERAWRLGQENQVTIYRLVTSGTIEEKIYHRQIYKQLLTNKVLKDPSQRRFFKSNDLYELFTFKGDDQSNETSAIFAGADVELNLKNLPKKSFKKRRHKFKDEIFSEPQSMKHNLEAKNILSKEKIEKMKQMAQELSRKIALNAKKEEINSNQNNSDSLSNEIPKVEKSNDNDFKTMCLKQLNVDEVEKEKSQKSKKHKKRNDKSLDGEIVPHLKKTKQYREVIKENSNKESEDDDYILKKLFSKSGVQSALKHDKLMASETADYALVEGEAEKVAKEAVKALKESRRFYDGNYTNSSSFNSSVKPRFGRKNLRPQSNTNADKEKSMSSEELIRRIRERSGVCLSKSSDLENPGSENSELLADIRNFISFGGEINNQASTQEIINKFKNRLPASQTPLFKALLNEICQFHRTSLGEGVWELRADFRW